VVEGIAEELEKSNIDDVVFKSSTTSTTIKPTNKKTKTKAKPSKQSTKTTPSRRKPKPKGTPTGHQGSPKNKKSPTKKVTTSKNASSGAELLDYRKGKVSSGIIMLFKFFQSNCDAFILILIKRLRCETLSKKK